MLIVSRSEKRTAKNEAYEQFFWRYIGWVWLPPRIPVANEGLAWNPLYTKYVIILVVTGILGGGHTQDIGEFQNDTG